MGGCRRERSEWKMKQLEVKKASEDREIEVIREQLFMLEFMVNEIRNLIPTEKMK